MVGNQFTRRHDVRVGVSLRPSALRWMRPAPFALCIGFAGALAVAMLQREQPFYTDSGGYWELGTTFSVLGHFSLLNFHDQLKGYSWPLVTYGLQTLSSDLAWTASATVKGFNALMFAVVGALLGPALAKAVWPAQPRWGISRRLALTALLIVFWRGFMNIPLSDFPALTMALVTLVAIARIDNPGWMLLAGVALGVTINIRVSYLPLMPAVLVLIAWEWFDQRGAAHASTAHRLLCVGLLVLGFAVASLPQSLSAHRYFKTWSFLAGATQPESEGEFYGPGIGVQSYDAFLSEGEVKIEGKYLYPEGQRLRERLPGGKVTSTSQYLGLYENHPLVMGGMLVRHVINGLDPLHDSPYAESTNGIGRTWGRIAGFLLLFVALLRVMWPEARRMLGRGRLRYLPTLVLCCVLTWPTQVERRYMLPVYVLVYVLALTPKWPKVFGDAGARRYRAAVLIGAAFMVYAAVVWYMTSDALNHLELVNGLTREIVQG
jgi:hypothetical protein